MRHESRGYLEETGGLGAHAGVQEALGTLDVVVKVVAEHVDQVNGAVLRLLACVAGEQH